MVIAETVCSLLAAACASSAAACAASCFIVNSSYSVAKNR